MTLSNVSDWSKENEKSSQPELLQTIDDDEDDGMLAVYVCVWGWWGGGGLGGVSGDEWMNG